MEWIYVQNTSIMVVIKKTVMKAEQSSAELKKIGQNGTRQRNKSNNVMCSTYSCDWHHPMPMHGAQNIAAADDSSCCRDME